MEEFANQFWAYYKDQPLHKQFFTVIGAGGTLLLTARLGMAGVKNISRRIGRYMDFRDLENQINTYESLDPAGKAAWTANAKAEIAADRAGKGFSPLE